MTIVGVVVEVTLLDIYRQMLFITTERMYYKPMFCQMQISACFKNANQQNEFDFCSNCVRDRV
jgi:hypothetical protein